MRAMRRDHCSRGELRREASRLDRSRRAAVVLLLALAAMISVLSGCSASGGAGVELVAPSVFYVSRDPQQATSDLRVQERSADGATVGLTITFDAGDLEGIVTVRRALDDCVVHLPVFHCDTQAGSTGAGGIQAFHLSPAKGAKAGDSGVLRYRVTAPGLQPVTGLSRIVVGRPELRVALRPDPGPVEPGGSLAVRLTIRNLGDVPARGVALRMEARDGVTLLDRHHNCRYQGDSLAWCRLLGDDVVIPPGGSYSLGARERLRAERDAGYPTVDFRADAIGTDYVPPAEIASQYRSGAGTPLRLVPATKADPAVTGKAGDGRQVLTLPVAVRNRSQLAAVGDTARGPVGSRARVRIGVRNNGPGSLPATVKVVFTVPEGTTVVESPYLFEKDEEVVDQDCRAVTADGTPLAEASVKQPRARRYVCTARVEAVGATTTFPFTLRIDKDGAGPGGHVSVSDGDPARPSRDTTPTDDVADVAVSVWPGPAWATPGFFIGAAVVIALTAAASALYAWRRRRKCP
ncbi:hypothetical protein AB0F46_30435 [Streptomyces sp. NPDC026665]|uniref:hypothetical protein n=1 Tax=Streptomyces sp. NPDC026665 TaxID=3154798 RepID=UPI0033EB6867